MKLNRRNVLVGIGTAAVGSGVALGSGAFTQVEATRNVTITTAGDSAALLTLEITSADLQGTNGDTISFEQDSINVDAVTDFDGAFEITNTSNNAVDVSIEDGSGSIVVGDKSSVSTGSGLNFVDSNDDLTGLGSGSTATLDVVVDLEGLTDTASADGQIPSEITITATQ